MKTCNRCDQEKPLSCFSKNKRQLDGLCRECKECAKSRAKARYKEQGAKMRLQMAKLRELDHDKRLQIERASRQRRKEAQRPLRNARQQIRNRLLATANKGILTSREIAGLYNQPCQNCGSKSNLSIDHIIPLARGGSHTIGNLTTLCRPCNSSKGKKLLVEWKKDLARMRGN